MMQAEIAPLNYVGLCDTQAITGEGLRAILGAHPRFRCAWVAHHPFMARQLVRQHPVEVLIVDKGFGFQPVNGLLDWVRQLSPAPKSVIWGVSLGEAEALRLLRDGVKGVLRKSCSVDSFIRCLEAVVEGRTWIEEFNLHQVGPSLENNHSPLTPREAQVLELVEQGLRNKEIAGELGIKPGTVKIHMKHIFEKTGVHGRYGLAIQGMRQKALQRQPEYDLLVAERAAV